MKFKVGDVVWNTQYEYRATIVEANPCWKGDCFLPEWCDVEQLVIDRGEKVLSYTHSENFELWIAI